MILPRVAASPVVLVLAATVAGLLAPSARIADLGDVLLAALVALVAVGIEPRALLAARSARGRIAAAVVLPFLFLVPLAAALGALFDESTRLGLVGNALATTEVAAVGFVALARGSTVVALATIAISLAASAVLAPLVAPLLGPAAPSTVELVGRFGLVVLVPLLAGLAVRGLLLDGRVDRPAEIGSFVALLLLIYGAVSGVEPGGAVLTAGLAAGLFVSASVATARLLRPLLRGTTGELLFALRDFAVAAALARALGGADAALVPAVYGALMLVAAAALAARSRRSGTIEPPGCGPG